MTTSPPSSIAIKKRTGAGSGLSTGEKNVFQFASFHPMGHDATQTKPRTSPHSLEAADVTVSLSSGPSSFSCPRGTALAALISPLKTNVPSYTQNRPARRLAAAAQTNRLAPKPPMTPPGAADRASRRLLPQLPDHGSADSLKTNTQGSVETLNEEGALNGQSLLPSSHLAVLATNMATPPPPPPPCAATKSVSKAGAVEASTKAEGLARSVLLTKPSGSLEDMVFFLDGLGQSDAGASLMSASKTYTSEMKSNSFSMDSSKEKVLSPLIVSATGVGLAFAKLPTATANAPTQPPASIMNKKATPSERGPVTRSILALPPVKRDMATSDVAKLPKPPMSPQRCGTNTAAMLTNVPISFLSAPVLSSPALCATATSTPCRDDSRAHTLAAHERGCTSRSRTSLQSTDGIAQYHQALTPQPPTRPSSVPITASLGAIGCVRAVCPLPPISQADSTSMFVLLTPEDTLETSDRSAPPSVPARGRLECGSGASKSNKDIGFGSAWDMLWTDAFPSVPEMSGEEA